MGSTIDLTDASVIIREIQKGTDLSTDAAEKGSQVVTDLARRIIELSIADPTLVKLCIQNSGANTLGHEILKLSFDYRNFIVAQDAISAGVSFQEVLLLADDSDLEKIGSSIYEMYRQFHAENVIDFFCNQLIGSKNMLRRSIAKEASLYSDSNLASILERDHEVRFGTKKATLRRRRTSKSLAKAYSSPDGLLMNRGSPFDNLSDNSLGSLLSTTSKKSLSHTINQTTRIAQNSISNICINYLQENENQLAVIDLLFVGVMAGIVIGISVGVLVGLFLGRIF